MTPDQASTLFEVVKNLTVTGVLAFNIWALSTGFWVSGKTHQKVEARADQLFDMLVQALGHGDKAIDMAKAMRDQHPRS